MPTGTSLSDIVDVRVEIYRVFPNDSDVGRTSGPPTFSTPQVPTRVNSPSDVALDDRSAAAGTLTFTPGIIQSSFTAANSVLNGIHPLPGFKTGGDGAVTGQEVEFNVIFSTPFSLPADHYFFVPQVQLASGDFFWLSAPRPIVPPGTPFPPGFTDLQEWIRNEDLAPDWLRVGTDIVGGDPRTDVQRGLHAVRPGRPRARQPDIAGPRSNRRVRRRQGATTQPSRLALRGVQVGQGSRVGWVETGTQPTLANSLAWTLGHDRSSARLRGRSAKGHGEAPHVYAAVHQRPACWPPSTCRTSPVTKAADSR